MFICFICEKQNITVQGLLLHFKIYHGLNSLSTFSCKQTDCSRDFQNLRSFRRHLQNSHSSNSHSHFGISCNSLEDNPLGKDSDDGYLPEDHTSSVEKEVPETSVNSEQFREIVSKSSSAFLAKLYSNPIIPRNVVQEIVDQTSEFLGSCYVSILKDKVLPNLQDNLELNMEIKSMFETLETPFEGMETEYLRLKHFEQHNKLIKPVPYYIGERVDTKPSNSNVILTPVPVHGQFVPIRSVLKELFEIPGVLNCTLNHMEQVKSIKEPVISILQGTLWKSIARKFEENNKTVFPLLLYFDDFETGNPLGSSAGIHKLGAIYYSLPCMPQQYLSSLENIFLALLFHSSDRSEFGNRAVFNVLIEELKFLETTGISVKTGSQYVQIYFSLTLILGDNLGLHSVLGLTESFSANFPCRICKSTKSDLKTQTKENVYLLRNTMNYDADVSLNDVSLTGIKEKCIWNDLNSYHLLTNITCDIMHDLFEGVCRYVMADVINHFTCNTKIFSLETLNFRTKHFNYGYIEKSNKPPTIKAEHVRQGVIIMSASEMLFLVRYFGLLVGDLVPEEDEVWELYLLLRQIIDLVTAKSFQAGCSVLLQTIVSEHNELYIKLFRKNLKPKFHFMLHYQRVIESVGPLTNIWSMRFESKHKQLKSNAHVVSSRKNVTYTLALKHQLLFCQRLIANKGLVDSIVAGPRVELSKSNYCQFEHCIPSNSNILHCCIAWVTCNGITYRNGMILFSSIKDDLPVFGVICSIFLDYTRTVHFVLKLVSTVGFDSHVHAYCIEGFKDFIFLPLSDLVDVNPLEKIISPTGVTHVPFRYLF